MNANLSTKLEGDTLHVSAFGVWAVETSADKRKARKHKKEQKAANQQEESAIGAAEKAAAGPDIKTITFELQDGTVWDSSLLAVFARMATAAKQRDVAVNTGALPEGMASLLGLTLKEPEQKSQSFDRHDPGILEVIGGKVLNWPDIAIKVTNFLGEVTVSLGRFFTGRSAVSRRDLWQVLRECGVDALPIVSLTSLLLGLILAFVSSTQLKIFGAEIYTAALVGVAMVRVMGPVLTGIVLAGRTGASFAATIASMQVNEEVDALVTFGISPIDFLVLPRVLGLVIMTPLLTIYADIMGILGGFIVGISMGISPSAYWDNTLTNISFSYVWIGLLHALVFGFIVSLSGCYQGMRSGRNAEAVGKATTAAVVNAIVGIIVSTSIITVIFTVIEI